MTATSTSWWSATPTKNDDDVVAVGLCRACAGSAPLILFLHTTTAAAVDERGSHVVCAGALRSGDADAILIV